MIENLEFEILHLKALGWGKDPILPLCAPLISDRLKIKKSANKIPHAYAPCQINFEVSKNHTRKNVSAHLTPTHVKGKANCKSVLHYLLRIGRKMGGDPSPATPAPTPPVA